MGAEGQENGSCITAASAGAGSIRIYVGGLGGSVSADDLKRTFSSPQLGNVDSVEIVRTKGRSFAYLDFLPVSDKGLAKLFSTYNGCMWKGGRLRLEKAKEHYLLRLKREWATDAELSSDPRNHNVDAVENPLTSEKLLKVRNSGVELRIFFPKLRKVRPLPFKGTGKHKYSFQHIEAPPLPSHFCDCEEHSVPFESGKGEPSTNEEKETGGMDDEEISMMTSIMSKIFRRESCSDTTSRIDEFATEAYNTTRLNDDLQFDNALADQGSDEDNLIINMVASSKSIGEIPLSSYQGPKTITANQESQTSKTRPIQRTPRSQRRMLSSNQKRKAPHDEDARTKNIFPVNAGKKAKMHSTSDDLEIIPDTQPKIPADIPQSSHFPVQRQKSAFRDLVSDTDNATFCISDITSDIGAKAEGTSKSENSDVQCLVEEENLKNKPFQPIEGNRSFEVVSFVPNAEMNKSAKNTSWLQKSSWMQLVGSSTDSSFSISQVLPGLNVENQDLQPLKGTDSSAPVNGNNQNLMKTDGSVSTGDVSKPHIGENKVPALDGGDQSNSVKKLRAVRTGNEALASSPGNKRLFRPKQTSVGGAGMSETFTFMRSSASMKQWTKTKAALSGSLKKKRNEK